MVMDALKAIKLSEEEADEIRRQAAHKAREIVLAAEREGDETLRNMTKEAQRNSKLLLEKAEVEAQNEIAILSETHDKQKEALIRDANEAMERAVSSIVGKVVGLNGNR